VGLRLDRCPDGATMIFTASGAIFVLLILVMYLITKDDE
jgi:hypothetical protein